MAPLYTLRKKKIKTPKTTRRKGDIVRQTVFFKVVDLRGVKSL